jgi:L-cysteine S-thiosulfotransferase
MNRRNIWFLLGFIMIANLTVAWAQERPDPQVGRELAFARSKGNCLACHQIADGRFAGDIGPPLLAMRQRFKNSEDLFAQIWDPSQKNPDTVMPPYGLNAILTEQEIRHIVAFLHEL